MKQECKASRAQIAALVLSILIVSCAGAAERVVLYEHFTSPY
jgi:hypothetical protein